MLINTNITSIQVNCKKDFSYDITEKLSNSLIYCREKEKEKILEFILDKDLKSLFICGQPGTGKTSLVLEIIKTYLDKEKNYITIYINCMSVHSIEDFYIQIINFLFKNIELFKNNDDRKKLNSFQENIDIKKNFNNKLLEILELYKSKFNFLILLDEVDNFYKKQTDIIFYEILNTPYISDTLIKLVLISNNAEFDKDIMPKIESRKIKTTRIVFKPYSHNEIYEILKQKLSEINILSYFQDEALKYISKKYGNKNGDLRPPIEILKNLILENKEKILEVINNDSEDCILNSNVNEDEIQKKNLCKNYLITLKHVLFRFTQKNQNFIELMNNLTTEQKIVLLSIYIIYDKNKNCEMDENLILDRYKIIKRYNFNSEFNIMDYKEIIKTFCDMGIIECKNKAKGKLKIKYDLDDLEIIFVDDKIFKMFKAE